MNRFLTDVKKHGKYVIYAAKATLRSEIADAKLSWIWWFLEPFCFMMVYAFVFGVLFHSREDYHALFVFLGISVWKFFTTCVKKSVGIVKRNKNIVGKVYLPKYLLLMQEVLVAGFKLVVCLVLMILLMIYYKIGFNWHNLLIVPVFLLMTLFTFGISCYLLHWGVFLKDLSNIMDIVIRFSMYFVGVFYSIENRMPKPFGTLLVRWNPMAFVIDSFRTVMIYQRSFDWIIYTFWFLVSAVLCVSGIRLIYRNENSYIKVL